MPHKHITRFSASLVTRERQVKTMTRYLLALAGMGGVPKTARPGAGEGVGRAGAHSQWASRMARVHPSLPHGPAHPLLGTTPAKQHTLTSLYRNDCRREQTRRRCRSPRAGRVPRWRAVGGAHNTKKRHWGRILRAVHD